VEQAQPEQAAAVATAMPGLTAGQQTALRDATADIEVTESVSAGAVPADRTANNTADDGSACPGGSSGCVEAAQDVPESHLV